MSDEQFKLLISKIEEQKDYMDTKFEQINNKLSDHDKEFVKINNKLSNHDKKFEQIDKNFDFVIKEISGIKQIQELFGKRQELLGIRQDQEFKFLVTEVQKIKNSGEEHYV